MHKLHISTNEDFKPAVPKSYFTTLHYVFYNANSTQYLSSLIYIILTTRLKFSVWGYGFGGFAASPPIWTGVILSLSLFLKQNLYKCYLFF